MIFLQDYDTNRDKLVTIDELEQIVKDRYKIDTAATRRFFDKVDVDRSGDLNSGEIVDFRHEIRRYVSDRNVQAELEVQNRREMAEIEAKLRQESEEKKQHRDGNVATEEEEEMPKKDESNMQQTSNETATPTTIKTDGEMENAKEVSNDSEEEEENNESEAPEATPTSTTTTEMPTTTTTTPESATSTLRPRKKVACVFWKFFILNLCFFSHENCIERFYAIRKSQRNNHRLHLFRSSQTMDSRQNPLQQTVQQATRSKR